MIRLWTVWVPAQTDVWLEGVCPRFVERQPCFDSGPDALVRPDLTLMYADAHLLVRFGVHQS